MRSSPALPALLAGFLLIGCTSTTIPGTLFTVHGSAGAPPAALAALRGTGDPAALRIGMYALYLSPNADCSAPVLVQDYGATAAEKDFVSNPLLFSGAPAEGAYQCVAIRMSDVIRVVPDTTFGTCIAGTEYAGDIYRAGDSSWVDVNLNPIIGTGEDSLPADDRVTLILTRDTAAAQARGFSTNQTLQLGSDLIVPGQSTFYWNGQGTVSDAGGQCGVNPGRPSFQ